MFLTDAVPPRAFEALATKALPLPPETWRERIQLGALSSDADTTGTDLEALVGAQQFRDLQDTSKCRTSFLAVKPDASNVPSPPAEATQRPASARPDRPSSAIPDRPDSFEQRVRPPRAVTVVTKELTPEERRKQLLRDHATRLTKRNGRKFLLKDPDTGEVFDHELEYLDQKIVVLYYLAHVPAEREQYEVDCLVRFFFDKPVFDRLTVSQLTDCMAGAQVQRHRKGALIAVPGRQVVHVIEGTLGKAVIPEVGNDFRGAAGKAKRSQLMKWMATLKDAHLQCGKHFIAGESVILDFEAVRCIEGEGRYISSEGLTPTPGVVHCDLLSGDWFCYVALSRHLIILTTEFPSGQERKEEVAEEKQKGDDPNAYAISQLLESHRKAHRPRRGARRISSKTSRTASVTSRNASVMSMSVNQQTGGVFNMEAILDGIRDEHVPRFRMIMQLGEEVKQCYILVSGEVRVTQNPPDTSGPKARSIEIDRITMPGTWMGAMACFESRRERFNYVAVSQKGCKVKPIRMDTFKTWLAPQLNDEFWQAETDRERMWSQVGENAVDVLLETQRAPEITRQQSDHRYKIPRECILQCCDLDEVATSKVPPSLFARLKQQQFDRKLQRREQIFQENGMVYEGKTDASAAAISSMLTTTMLRRAPRPTISKLPSTKGLRKDMLIDWLMSDKARIFSGNQLNRRSSVSSTASSTKGKDSDLIGVRFGRSSIYMPSSPGGTEDGSGAGDQEEEEEDDDEDESDEEDTEEEQSTSDSEESCVDKSEGKRGLPEESVDEKSNEQVAETRRPTGAKIRNLKFVGHRDSLLKSEKPQNPKTEKHRDLLPTTHELSPESSRSQIPTPTSARESLSAQRHKYDFSTHRNSLMVSSGLAGLSPRSSLPKETKEEEPTDHEQAGVAVINFGYSSRAVIANKDLDEVSRQVTGVAPRASEVEKDTVTSPSARQVTFSVASDKIAPGHYQDDLNSTESLRDLNKLLKQRIAKITQLRNQRQHLQVVKETPKNDMPNEALLLSPQRQKQLGSRTSETDTATPGFSSPESPFQDAFNVVTCARPKSPPFTIKARPRSAGKVGCSTARRPFSGSARGVRQAERPKTPDASSRSFRFWRSTNSGVTCLPAQKSITDTLRVQPTPPVQDGTREVLSPGMSPSPFRRKLIVDDFVPASACPAVTTPLAMPSSKDMCDATSRNEKSAEIQGSKQAVKTLTFPG